MSRRHRKGMKVDGWVVLDKPVGMTSTTAVARVKRALNARKAGHAGTLDPLASGCLPIALGEATKTVSFAMNGRKAYRFTVRWGTETGTDDAEGAVQETSSVRSERAEIAEVIPEFVGLITQVPPVYSAIKVAGERAYDRARDGETVTLEPRTVEIHELSLLDCPDPDHSVFFALCGKGTYIRALARDMGRRLGSLGHVETLRRLSVGPFRESDMIALELLDEFGHNPAASARESAPGILRPVETALDDIPALAVADGDAVKLRRGQAVIIRGRDAPLISGVAYATSAGRLVALGEVSEGAFCPRRIFNLEGANRR